MPRYDARQRTRVYLDAKVVDANLTKDDDATELSWISAFGMPPYSITRVFIDKEVDLIFSIGVPKSKPMIQYDLSTWGYREQVPILTYCIDKPGITGEKVKWKADLELRTVFETYPYGSIRHLTDETDNDQIIGGLQVYGTSWMFNYRRDLTI